MRQEPSAITPGGNASFRRLQGTRYKAIASTSVAPDEIRRVVESPESLLEGPEIQVVKQGRSALIVKTTLCLSETESPAAYKRSGCRSPGRRLLRSLLTARAARNLHLAHAMLRDGIATPRPLLAVLPRWRAFLRPCYLATEWIDGAVPIDVFLRSAVRIEPGKSRAALRQRPNASDVFSARSTHAVLRIGISRRPIFSCVNRPGASKRSSSTWTEPPAPGFSAVARV